MSSPIPPDSDMFVPDLRRAWTRLAVAVLIGSLGSVGMWSVVVALPAVQTEFAASRGTASLAFTLVMLGFGSGGVLTGKITDRYGIVTAIGLGIGILGLGYIGAGLSNSIWQFILVHFAIGLSSSATFGPLMAEASHWFSRYRGLAVAIAASGNYIGGTIWPPLVNWGMQTYGWRHTHVAVGIFTAVAMTLALIGLRMLMGAAAQRDHVNAPPPGPPRPPPSRDAPGTAAPPSPAPRTARTLRPPLSLDGSVVDKIDRAPDPRHRPGTLPRRREAGVKLTTGDKADLKHCGEN